jgi:hypothetical protein
VKYEIEIEIRKISKKVGFFAKCQEDRFLLELDCRLTEDEDDEDELDELDEPDDQEEDRPEDSLRS